MNVLLLCRSLDLGEKMIRDYKLEKKDVACFCNRREAIKKLTEMKQKPNFVVVDVEMRNKEARVFLRQIKGMRLKSTTVIEFFMSQKYEF